MKTARWGFRRALPIVIYLLAYAGYRHKASSSAREAGGISTSVPERGQAGRADRSELRAWLTAVSALLLALGTVAAAGIAAWASITTSQRLESQARSSQEQQQEAERSKQFNEALFALESNSASARVGALHVVERTITLDDSFLGAGCEVATALINTMYPRGEKAPAAPTVDVLSAFSVLSRTKCTTLESTQATQLVIPRAQLAGLEVPGINASTMDATDANLHGSLLSDSDLRVATLNGADLSMASMTGVDLQHAQAVGTNFEEAWLADSDFSKANLADAIFRKAYLGGVLPKDADPELDPGYSSTLPPVKFDSNTYFDGADFRGTDLSGVDLSKADLRGIVYDSSTEWPKGYSPPEPSRSAPPVLSEEDAG